MFLWQDKLEHPNMIMNIKNGYTIRCIPFYIGLLIWLDWLYTGIITAFLSILSIDSVHILYVLVC